MQPEIALVYCPEAVLRVSFPWKPIKFMDSEPPQLFDPYQQLEKL